MSLDFDGLSGHISFDPTTGGRDPRQQSTILQNWPFDPVSGAIGDMVIMGEYIVGSAWDNGSAWSFDDSITFANGASGLQARPPEITPLPEDWHFLSANIKVLGYVEIAVLELTAALCLAWLVANRRTRIVRRGQGVLLALVVVGCAASGLAILGFVGDDGVAVATADVACNLGFSLFALGYSLALAALGAKFARVRSVFASTPHAHGMSIAQAVAVVAAAVGWQGVIVLALNTAAPMQWLRFVLLTDVFGFPTSSVGACIPNSTASQALMIVLYCGVFVCLLAMFSVLFGFDSDVVAPEAFFEARWLGVVTAIVLQVLLVGVPVALASYTTSPDARFVTFTFICFFCNAALLVLLFAPKCVRGSDRLMDTSRGAGKIDLDVREGLRVPRLRKRFEKVAMEQCVEDVFFLQDADWFKANCAGMASDRDRALNKARIVQLFLSPDAMLRVDASPGLVQAAVDAAPSEDVFEALADAVAAVLDASVDFVAHGGAYDVASKHMNVLLRDSAHAGSQPLANVRASAAANVTI